MFVMDCLRAAGHAILPKEGGWVTIKGNPFAPKGMRIPKSIVEAGVRHLDIYYGYGEKLCIPLDKYIKSTIARYGKNIKRANGSEEKREIMRVAGNDFYDYLVRFQRSGHFQLTLITIVSPHHETIRFYNGELAPYSDELINHLLDEGLLSLNLFGPTEKNPITEEAIRDIVDSLQVDGMTYHQAYNHAISAGIVEDADFVYPQWFYRPIGAYREMFVEEHVI